MKREEYKWVTNLNPIFYFDNYVVGDTNRLAKVSAKEVAEKKNGVHNPLFIYGKSGYGKTHLMHAIGNYVVQHSDRKVLYVTSNMFMNDYIESIKYKELEKEFEAKYKDVDVLLIDDIGYLIGTGNTERAFFALLDYLCSNEKQVVMSADRNLEALKITERLRSCFKNGLSVEISAPDFGQRRRIINQKMKEANIGNRIEPDIIEFLAESIQNDVLMLEGAVNRIGAYITSHHLNYIRLEDVKVVLDGFLLEKEENFKDNKEIEYQSSDALFKVFLENLKNKVNTDSYNAWFMDMELLEVNDTAIIIQVPTEVHKKILSDHYYASVMQEVANKIFGVSKIELVIDPESKLKKEKINENKNVSNDTKNEEKKLVNFLTKMECSEDFFHDEERILMGVIRNYYRRLRLKEQHGSFNPIVVFACKEAYELSSFYDYFYKVIKSLSVKQLQKMEEVYVYNDLKKEFRYFKQQHIDYSFLVHNIKAIYGDSENLVVGAISSKFVKEKVAKNKPRVILTSLEQLDVIQEVSCIFDFILVPKMDHEIFMSESVRLTGIFSQCKKNTDATLETISEELEKYLKTIYFSYQGVGHQILNVLFNHSEELHFKNL